MPQPLYTNGPRCTTCFDLQNWSHIKSQSAAKCPSGGQHAAQSSDSFILRPFISEIVESSSGCPTCFLLVGAATKSMGISTDNKRGQLTILGRRNQPLSIAYWPPVFIGRGCKAVSNAELYRPVVVGNELSHLDSLSRLDEPWIGYAPRLSSGQTLETAAKLTRTWLDGCLENHNSCTEYPIQGNRQLPARLIRVAPQDDVLRIHQPENDKTADYVAFSYCRGGASFSMKNSANLTPRFPYLSWDSLPAILRDAVLFTYHLGIEYLWVDALCIVQDDPSDLMQESFRIGDIFQGAILTLSATSGAIFGHTKDEMDLPSLDCEGQEVCVRRPNSLAHEAVFGRDRGSYFPQPFGIADPFPTLHCGWSFQERALSPRVVHWMGNELAWECRETVRCECSIQPPTRHYEVPTPDVNGPWALRTWDWVGASVADTHRLWMLLVEQYTLRDLTEPSDRLVAFSGIAKLFEDKCGPALGNYLAGVWSKFLPLSLTWVANWKHLRRSKRITGPSWSWGSTTGPITWHLVKQDSMAAFELDEASVAPQDPTSMRPGIEGKLVISCFTTHGRLASANFPFSDVRICIGGVELKFRPDICQWTDVPQVRAAMDEEERIEAGQEFLCAEVYCAPAATSEPCISSWLVLRWSARYSCHRRAGIMFFFETSPERLEFNDAKFVSILRRDAVYKRITVM